ncbi:MAG TPA: hypothetical protein VFM19_04565 [Candidatus Limnocylindria bacterium]|nr:hypothetical protein [Candidatus Limnocylindria bacterium]
MPTLYFYELHEGEDDLFSDALLVSETDHPPAAFDGLVRTARAAVIGTFEEDTLVEAIARELERHHGFTYIGDEKLRASMSVGVEDDETFLVEGSDDFRSMVVELDRS